MNSPLNFDRYGSSGDCEYLFIKNMDIYRVNSRNFKLLNTERNMGGKLYEYKKLGVLLNRNGCIFILRLYTNVNFKRI